MSHLKTFNKIKEGDKLKIGWDINHVSEYNAELVEIDEDGNKYIAFDMVEYYNPCLVNKYDKIYLEKEVIDMPRGWTEYVPVKKLEILE